MQVSNSLASSAALIDSLLQLKLVESVLTAMRDADLASAAHVATDTAGVPIKNSGAAAGSSCDCHRICPDPRFAARPLIHLPPHYAPRVIVHQPPKIERDPSPVGCHKLHPPCLPELPQPPWKLLPWQDRAPAQPLIKTIVVQPDTQGKGNLIDLFC